MTHLQYMQCMNVGTVVTVMTMVTMERQVVLLFFISNYFSTLTTTKHKSQFIGVTFNS